VGKGKCDGKQATHTSTLVVQNQTSPKITVTLDCANALVAGGIVSGVVKNTGDIALRNVVVVSSLPTPGTVVVSSINLAPGETQEFAFDTQTANVADIRTLTIVATGKNICGDGEVRDVAYCGAAPGPSSVTISRASSQTFVLKWTAGAGTKYRVQYKKSLLDSAWITLDGDVEGVSANAQVTKVDSNAIDGVRIYRVITVP